MEEARGECRLKSRSSAPAATLRRLLLSHDVSSKDDLYTHGGTDYHYLLTGFVPLSVEAGLSDEIVHILLVENPCAALVNNENG